MPGALRFALGVAWCLLPVGVAGAQAATPPGGRPDDERDGMAPASGRDLRVALSGYVQVDGRWVSGPQTRAPDGLLLRRARLVFDASSPDGWHLRLQPDFGQGRVQVQDAYVGFVRHGITARAGRFRPAFGTERMQSSSTLLAPERGIVNSLMPSRNFGAQFMLERGPWRLAAGGFRTPIGSDVASIDTDGDINATAGTGHDLLLRVAHVREQGGRYVEMQSGALWGRERGTVDAPALSRVLSVAQQPILTFVDDGTPTGTARAAGARARLTSGALIGTRRHVLALEGAWFAQRVAHGGVERTPVVGAGTLRFARVWHGERARSQDVVPASARGALDVGVRAGFVRAWGEGLRSIITRNSVSSARTVGVAMSWVPTRLTRATVSYDLTERRSNRTQPEHALHVRWQQGF